MKQTNSTDNSDADMTEIAKMQLEEAEGKIAVEGRNQVYVDSKRSKIQRRNVMVEIRAGTGGDEARVFWNLFRMCTRNISETEVGELLWWI
jgi:peptide chain release factor 1